MDEIQKRRRNEHYKKEPEMEKKFNYKVIIQLLICMALMFCFVYDGTRNSEVIKTLQGYFNYTTSHQWDISVPVKKVRSLVEDVVGTPDLPVSGKFFDEKSEKNYD